VTATGTGTQDYSHLAGHEFPGGSYELPGYQIWLWADAVQADPRDPHAHPEIAYMIGLHGGGASIADIMALLGADADSGVMFGELSFEFAGPILADRTYEVRGRVLSVDRKEGRKAGVFDLATFVHELTAAGDSMPTTRIEHVWVFPRTAAR
jgi:hypothetical protein